MITSFVYPLVKGDERLVEIPFFIKVIQEYHDKYGRKLSLLDVGGQNSGFVKDVLRIIEYNCCDLACGNYTGDFLTYNFKGRTFDVITALSSIEHFGRNDEDYRAFRKVSELLTKDGIFLLSVPCGKYYYEPELFCGFHHYDKDRIMNETTRGGLSKVEDRYFLYDNKAECFFESDYTHIKNVTFRDKGAPNACGVFLGVFKRSEVK